MSSGEKCIIDKSVSVPLHTQIEDYIRAQLLTQAWPPSSKIPSESELSALFGVSRMTVRNVITKFVHSGEINRVPGKGTFVAERKIETVPLTYNGIREQLETQGNEVRTQLLVNELVDPTPELFKVFGESIINTKIHRIVRVRYVKNEPFSYHISYVPEPYAPDIADQDLVDSQLCHILAEHYNLARSRVTETLESVVANKDEAKHLKVKQGQPLIMLTDTIYNENGVIFEYSKVIFKLEQIKLRFEV